MVLEMNMKIHTAQLTDIYEDTWEEYFKKVIEELNKMDIPIQRTKRIIFEPSVIEIDFVKEL